MSTHNTRLNFEQMIGMFRKMLRIRLFEEQLVKLHDENRTPRKPFLWCSTQGQEAVSVGICSALQVEDLVVSTHRAFGQYIAKGGSLRELAAEQFGKATGTCKGKGGYMHITAPQIGMLTATGIVGATIPIATGVAHALKLRRSTAIAVCFFGDGASNNGDFHEGLNIAAVWKLPILLVCENNLYATSTHLSRTSAVPHVVDRVAAYKIPGLMIDGMDVVAMYSAATEAIERIRRGSGPILLECKTYRYQGQFAADTPNRQASYRTVTEIEEWKRKDPLVMFKSKLREDGILSEQGIRDIETEIGEEVFDAIRFAEESPDPMPEEAMEDIYA